MEGLDCMDDFTLKCLSPDYRDYYNMLYAKTTGLIIDLCVEAEYQKGEARDLCTGITATSFSLLCIICKEN